MVSFWSKLKSTNKLSSKIYNLLTNLKNYGGCYSKWLEFIEKTCNSTGNNYFLNSSQEDFNITFIKLEIRKTLQDQFIQSWRADIENSSRGEFYGIYF